MGTMHHHALIVTTSDKKTAEAAHKVASDLSPHVTPIITATINAQFSFAILPDGSKEGWPESDQGDRARQELIDWLNSQAYEDGSNSLEWCEVSFGELLPTLKTNQTTP